MERKQNELISKYAGNKNFDAASYSSGSRGELTRNQREQIYKRNGKTLDKD